MLSNVVNQVAVVRMPAGGQSVTISGTPSFHCTNFSELIGKPAYWLVGERSDNPVEGRFTWHGSNPANVMDVFNNMADVFFQHASTTEQYLSLYMRNGSNNEYIKYQVYFKFDASNQLVLRAPSFGTIKNVVAS